MSNMGYRENMVSYLEALEIEKHKIQMFQRELPLCLELVNQAIEGCRKQLYGTSMDHVNGRSDCSKEEETSAKGTRKLVLEEFIPLKSCDDDDDDDDGDDAEYSREQPKDNNKDKMKSDWLRSAQLWNPSSDLLFKEDLPSSEIVMEVKGNKKDGGIINKPLNKEEISSGKSKEALLGTKLDRASSSPSPASSTAETTVTTKGISGGNNSSNNNKKEDKQLNRQSPTTTTQSRRKQRRCWSHDLHRSFVEALQQLGGPEVATPKQIRELMKVDGLTNDEVKSHLQKYRLHAKRPSSANHDNMVVAPPPPPQQFVVVGGIWMPPPPPPPSEFPSVSAAPTPSTATDLYGAPAAPRAKIPQAPSFIQKLQRQSHLTNEDRCSHGKRRVLSNSTASSSSVYASAVC